MFESFFLAPRRFRAFDSTSRKDLGRQGFEGTAVQQQCHSDAKTGGIIDWTQVPDSAFELASFRSA